MNFLHRIQHQLELKRREADTAHELAQLSDRALGDLGLVRGDIRRVAREAVSRARWSATRQISARPMRKPASWRSLIPSSAQKALS